jgi:hypothetical protein
MLEAFKYRLHISLIDFATDRRVKKHIYPLAVSYVICVDISQLKIFFPGRN